MNSIPVNNQETSPIQNGYTNANQATRFCGFINFAASAEMAYCAAKGILAAMKGPITENLQYNLSANLGGAIFYGLCAANPFPGGAALGATIYTIYSFCNPSAYFTAGIINDTAHFIHDWMITPFNEKIFEPLGEHVIEPLIKKIAFVFRTTFALMLKIPLPKHPVWIGIAILVAATCLYKTSRVYFAQKSPEKHISQ